MNADDDLLATIVSLHEKRDWRSIVNKYREHPDRSKVLWVYPTEDNFTFIQNCMKTLNCDQILSVGCGSGLLEWMITEATGIPVSGVEIDGVWWQCKYAPPTFIPLLLTSPTLDRDIINLLLESRHTALLFCYFNNNNAFIEYLKYFAGTTVIIIGPSGGKGVHTEPKPFDDIGTGWVLHDSREVGCTKDFIAIYKKR